MPVSVILSPLSPDTCFPEGRVLCTWLLTTWVTYKSNHQMDTPVLWKPGVQMPCPIIQGTRNVIRTLILSMDHTSHGITAFFLTFPPYSLPSRQCLAAPHHLPMLHLHYQTKIVELLYLLMCFPLPS
jgi:hypothetical protein